MNRFSLLDIAPMTCSDMLRKLYQTEIDSLTAPLPELTERIYDLTHAE